MNEFLLAGQVRIHALSNLQKPTYRCMHVFDYVNQI
jgi:hypothetical protein